MHSTSGEVEREQLPFGIEDKTHYDEGYLTPAQVNSIFRILPVDITYVNEDDQVVFYNRNCLIGIRRKLKDGTRKIKAIC